MADKVDIEIGGDTSRAQASLKDLEVSAKKSFEKMANEAEESGEDVSKAFRRSGIRTEKAIRESSEKAKRDFEKIKNSGVASANDIKRAHNAMTAKLKKNSRELVTSGKRVSDLFKKMKGHIVAASVAAVGFFGVKALRESIKFEAALLDLQKVLGDTEGRASDYTAQIEALSKTYGDAQSEILQGVAIFRQAGFVISESLLLQEQAMKLAISSELEVAEAAELIKRALKGFKAPASDVIRLTDVLNEVSNNYGTNLKELAIGMSDISPIAKKMGFSFEETVGLLTPIIEVFGSGSEAAQALKTGLVKLIDDALPVTNALARMGISQKEFNEGMGEGNEVMRSGRDIYFDVAKRFETLAGNQKLVQTAQLLGVRQAGKMVEVYDGLGLSTEITNKAMKAAGSINKEVATRLAATEEHGRRAARSFDNMAKSIGDLLLPAWNMLLDIAIPTMDAITRGIRGMSKAIRSIPDISTFLTNPFSIFSSVVTPDKVVKNLTKETKELNDANKKAVQVNNDVEDSLEKQVVALLDIGKAKKEEKEILKDQKRQVEKNLDIELDAIDKKKTAQKTLNATIKTAIQETKTELRRLLQDVEAAQAFLSTIKQKVQEGQRGKAQRGFNQVEKLISDLEFAERDFKKAAKERAKGNVKSARELTLSAVNAAAKVMSADPLKLQEAGTSTAGLAEAVLVAERMQKAAVRFAEEMEASAQQKVPAVSEELKTLEGQLKNGKSTLDGLREAIKAARADARLLKEKLNEDTKATHTQVVNTVSTDDTSSVPGFSKGVRLPGYGGGDKIFARLEAGENVLKKESVRSLKTLGASAMDAIHKGDIRGLIDSLPLPGYKDGGEVKAEGSTNVNLIMGQKSFPMTTSKTTSRNFVSEIKKTNIVHGRSEKVY